VWLGLALPVLGVIVYAVQLWMGRLTAPWYVPAAATLGVVCLIAALAQGWGVRRLLALVVVALFCAAAWTFLLALRLPEYTGPVAVGQAMPAFATARADGTTFTHRDLEGDRDSVLVFFRGRW
jgi:hypothetical protein